MLSAPTLSGERINISAVGKVVGIPHSLPNSSGKRIETKAMLGIGNEKRIRPRTIR